jgi:3-methyl-2-oxobutanoate hydroxymethyltransferase
MARITVSTFQEMKDAGEPISMLTAYDYSSARLVDAAGCDSILVVDSLGNVVLGYESTLPVTLDTMLHHTAAVARGTQHALVIGDMPFMTYQISPEQAIANAGRFLAEAGAQAVKIEGGMHMASTVRRLTNVGIPVCGHIGLTPQSVHAMGGYKVQGKTDTAADRLLEDAAELEDAGAFAIVLECIPEKLAKRLTERLRIPTIGIGAGPHTSGQVQVYHDVLGLGGDFVPKHAKRYAEIGAAIGDAVGRYVAEVRAKKFAP